MELKHWTSRSISDFVYRIASDFVIQLEKKMQSDGITNKALAKRAGVSEGRLSQVLNNPGNLTLKSTVQYAQALGMKVAIVAYEDRKDPGNDFGPVNSEIFSTCWQATGAPRDFFELAGSTNIVQFEPNPATAGTDIGRLMTFKIERFADAKRLERLFH
jgi:transcriptional regulator with XRE-family HTH domain